MLAIILSVASVGLGTWDLWKHRAKDVLLSVTLAEGSLAAGVGLEALFPGGFAVGVALSALVGVRGMARIGKTREAELLQDLKAAPDDASRLLVLNDRIDMRASPETGVERFVRGWIALWLALGGVAFLALGLTYDVWEALLTGVGLLFFPVGEIARSVLVAAERGRLEGRMAAVCQTEDLLPSSDS